MQTKTELTWLKKLTPISLYHYYKLIGRTVLLGLIVVEYIFCLINDVQFFMPKEFRWDILKWVVWAFYMVEMFLRLFPSRLESMGCQKQFSRNYRPKKVNNQIPAEFLEKHGGDYIKARNDWSRQDRKRGRLVVLAAWIALNAVIGGLFFARIIDQGIMMIISMCYAVCDMICILFFCPFQTWFMKNRCCARCYIYNWDYIMMFTPLIFVRTFYTHTLVGLALIVLIQWEIRLRVTPQRFNPKMNDALACKNCTEKLCKHKKQLQGFILKLEQEAKSLDKPIINEILEKPLVNEILGQNNEFDVEGEEDQ